MRTPKGGSPGLDSLEVPRPAWRPASAAEEAVRVALERDGKNAVILNHLGDHTSGTLDEINDQTRRFAEVLRLIEEAMRIAEEMPADADTAGDAPTVTVV